MSPSPRLRPALAVVVAVALSLSNLGAGCPTPTPPADLPELAPTTAVGTLAGADAVSDDGTFTYRIPIAVPPGRAGMQPSLALAYASTSAESSLGVGFRLDGLSSMSRCGQSVAIDGRHRGVELDEEDRLCIDGARLLAVEGAEMAPGAAYRTEVESWRRVETMGFDASGVSGPLSFRVRMPDGRERFYGTTPESRLELTRSDGTRVVSTWFLAQERDPRGNTISYRYEHVTPSLPPTLAEAMDPDPPLRDIVRIARIDYTGFIAPGGLVTSGDRSVRFEYADVARVPDIGVVDDTGGLTEAPPPEDGFLEGTFGWRAATFPLQTIRTFVEAELVHEVRLVGDDANTARRYRLTSAELCANAPATGAVPGSLVCLPPTRFMWRDRLAVSSTSDPRYGQPTFERHQVGFEPARVRRDYPCGDFTCSDPASFLVLDANGDGADDVIYLSRRDGPDSAPRLVIRMGGYTPRLTASIAESPFGPEREVITSFTGSELEWLTSAESFNTNRMHVLDWDLDGRDDLVFVGGGAQLRVLRSLGTGRFEEADAGLSMPWNAFEVLDLDGDGRTDIAVCAPDPSLPPWGDPPAEPWMTPNLQLHAGRWQFARRAEDGGWHPWVATSAADRTDCGIEYGNGFPRNILFSGPDPLPYDFRPLIVDADGDGTQELLFAAQLLDDLSTPTREISPWLRSARWNGEGVVVRPIDVAHGRYQVADLNGDGYHDLVTSNLAVGGPEPLPLLYLSSGTRGAEEQPMFHRVELDLEMPGRRLDRQSVDGSTGVRQRSMLPLLPFDINGDGRGDLLAATLPSDAPLPTIDLCPGRPFCDASAWTDSQYWSTEWAASTYDLSYPTSIVQAGDWRADVGDGYRPRYLTSESYLLDADGDGALDLFDLQRVDAAYESNGNPLERPSFFGTSLHHNVRSQPALLERITDGFGATVLVDYTPLSDSSVYQPTRACAYPTRCTTDSRYVVQRVRHDSGLAETSFVEETHFYQGGRADVLGRGFLGFQRHVVRNLTSGQVEDRRFDNTTYDVATRSYPRAHRPRAIMSYRVDPTSPIGGSTVFVGSKQTFDHGLVTTDVGTHYVTVGRTRTQAYEETTRPLLIGGGDPFLGRTPVRDTTTTTTYDDFGNPFVVTERVAGIPDAVVTRSTWINDTGAWRIGLPDTQISRTNEGDQACSLEARTFYTVDVGLAEITSIRRAGRRPDPTMERETRVLERDRYGNITAVEILSYTDPRTVRIGYEPAGYFLESITNSLGHTTQLDVEARFGQPHRTIDPNGVETIRSFDGFGRVRTERTSGRGGAEITYDLPDATGRHQVRVDPAEGGHDVVELDRLGRPVERYTDHAYVTSREHLEYDALGRLVLESEPFTGSWSPGMASTRHHFDGLGRLRFSEGPDGERVDFAYPRSARHVTRAGEGTRITELDAAGRTLAAVEPGPTGGPGGRTAYQYCRSGLLRRTFDPRGHVTTVEYDDLGRRTLLDDPAAGVARFRYDALDELVRTEDAEGRVSRWERDTLGRVNAVFHDAEGTVDRFFFDTAVTPSGRPLLGLLGSMESGDGVIDTFEYDDLARARAQTRLVDGRFLRTEDTLDEHGRVRSTTLPDALGFGAVTIANEYDPASGEPLEVRLNGTRVWHLDDQDARGAPTEETLGSPALGLISRSSGYTEGGQLASLRSSAGLTGLQDLHYLYESGRLWARDDVLAPRTEVYAYDQLSRLTDVYEGATAREHYESDEVGNLLSTHDGALLYADPTRPYAATEVSGVDGATFDYDAVGNAERAGDLHITYTQRNLPRTVDSSKSGLVRYTYDAEGGRATKRGRDVDVTYFGLYELERRGMVLYERISIPTPVGVVAQLERVAPGGPNNPERLRWLLTDRQGSVETTWLPGEDPEHHRYDAYGGVLTSSDRVSGERPTERVSYGYTGHEHEDEVGLINMGGRIYMPRLRRFLTADPVVSEPAGQGLNAYSYVQGDPINWADPSGWYREGPGYQLPEDIRDPRGLSRSPYGADCDEGGLCVYEPDYVHGERGGAGAAGQDTAMSRDDGPMLAELSNVAEFLDVDLPGFDEGAGQITNFYEASRAADDLVIPMWRRTALDGALFTMAENGAHNLMMSVPGIAILRYGLTALDPRLSDEERTDAAYLMAVEVAMLGAGAIGAAVHGAIPLNRPGYYLYHIVRRSDDRVMYVGITDNIARREAEHVAAGRLTPGYRMRVVARDLTYGQARGYEQADIGAFGTHRPARRGARVRHGEGNRVWSYRAGRIDPRGVHFQGHERIRDAMDRATRVQEVLP